MPCLPLAPSSDAHCYFVLITEPNATGDHDKDGQRLSPPPPPPPPSVSHFYIHPPPPPHQPQLAAHPHLNLHNSIKQIWDQWFGQPPARACKDIAINQSHWTISNETMRPFVDIPDMSDIGVGESVCVRVIVPLRPSNSTDAFVPLPSAPWDSILLDMVGLSSGISIPVNLQPVSDMRNRRQDSVHIYEANVVLRDIDVYHPEGFLEFRDARWNPEGPSCHSTAGYNEAQQVVVKDEHRASPYSLWKYTELPLCTDSNAEGRWVYVHNIPFDPELVPLADNLNRVWLPYTCRLRRVSYAQFAQCLVSKYPRVHWYGDSNVRRSLKKISSLGEWCSTKEDQESAVCTCEDYRSDFTRFSIHARNTFFDIDAVDGGLSLANETDFARVPENKARMAVFKIEGLTARNVSPWIDRFANGTAVIISLVNWDAAFTSLDRLS
ncbi:hypothetical protein BX661DRAFT_186551 [Kickxella alabastrina]|uniref:uncharacterized protein n=1 Tax=Kickxella alabastrina TaxID=61397 RepID=UPI0022200B5C|nr:uncharacterized protein BX661DRAFT_186551 [Kickxella alabastrina]KAI7823411.1 hypothetical protein BX661DRAFT_186551 [Kickxella alabastrina]